MDSMDSTPDVEALACLEVRAEAHWAGSRSALPVMGQAWFVASGPALSRGGRSLAELVELARAAYPTMHSAVERMGLDQSGRPQLRLRALEVYEDDLGAAGLSPVRKALETRAQVCGMRIVASLNAVAGRVVAHGMPLDRAPGPFDRLRALSLVEEIELFESASAQEGRGRSDRGRM